MVRTASCRGHRVLAASIDAALAAVERGGRLGRAIEATLGVLGGALVLAHTNSG